MKVLFLGSSTFSSLVLECILRSKHEVVAVITQPDAPSGRGQKLKPSCVKTFASDNGIKVLTYTKLKENIEEIKKIDYDIALVASYGQILPQAFLDIKLCINVHPSLLPRYRGATPIQSALLNGDKISGVTIMKVAAKVDSGDILLQQKCEILDSDDYISLTQKFGTLGGQMAVQALDLIAEGKEKFTPQDDEKATYVRMFDKSEGKLDFNKTMDCIVNMQRAFVGTISTYFVVNGQKIKVGALQKAPQFSGQPNQILCCKKRLIIACKDGAVEILQAQAPNSKMLDSLSFLNGFKFLSGEVNNA